MTDSPTVEQIPDCSEHDLEMSFEAAKGDLRRFANSLYARGWYDGYVARGEKIDG